MWGDEGWGCNAALWTGEGLCSAHCRAMSWIGGRDGNVIIVVAQGHNGEKRDGKKREKWPIKAKLKKERTDRGVSNETR
jgi:hypothetical protein